MKKHIILWSKSTMSFRGVIPPSEEIWEAFKSQRNMNQFEIKKTNDPEILHEVDDLDLYVEYVYGYPLFKDEYEYMMGSFDQLVMEMKHSTVGMFNIIQNIKFSKEEKEIVYNFLEIMTHHLMAYTDAVEEDDDLYDLKQTPDYRFFNLEKMAKNVVSVFEGGR